MTRPSDRERAHSFIRRRLQWSTALTLTASAAAAGCWVHASTGAVHDTAWPLAGAALAGCVFARTGALLWVASRPGLTERDLAEVRVVHYGNSWRTLLMLTDDVVPYTAPLLASEHLVPGPVLHSAALRWAVFVGPGGPPQLARRA